MKVSHFQDYLPDSYKIKNKNGRLATVTKDKYRRRSAQRFIKKLRNGISHQNIDAIKGEQDKWVSVTIKDFDIDNNTHEQTDRMNFEIKISVEKLKELAIAISSLVPDRKI